MKRGKKHGKSAVATQLRTEGNHPFGAISRYTPLGGGEAQVYRSLREAVPLLDAAVSKLVRLTGGFQAVCQDKRAQERLNQFLQTVPCGRGQQGMDSFLAAYLDSLLTYGRAVGELVVAQGHLSAVIWGDVTRLEVEEGASPLECVLCGPGEDGLLRPLPYPHLLLFTTLNPEPANPYGVSMLRSMPFWRMCY